MQMTSTTLAGTLFGAVLATAGLTVLPIQDAQARPRYETCQSRGDDYQYCRTETRGGVRIQRQLSRSACIQNRSWGYDRGGIWVKDGCRAEFMIGDDRGDDWNRDRGRDRGDDRYNRGDDRYNGGGDDRGRDREDDRNRGGRRFVCDAQGPGYRLCRVDTRGGVRMIRQLSKTPCRQNRTWGYERGGVWVDGGCRAEFEVR